jgi:pyridoxine/pyridoxamine 5'-phosphate oxidase
MKRMVLCLLLTTLSAVALPQTGQQDSKAQPPPNVCDAAAAKLREANTQRVVLMLRLDNRGRVQSFKTESPKGLRLEKVKEVAAEIKKIRLGQAKQYGSPDVVKVKVEFDCSTGHPTAVTQ